jgi:hypothetical protein
MPHFVAICQIYVALAPLEIHKYIRNSQLGRSIFMWEGDFFAQHRSVLELAVAAQLISLATGLRTLNPAATTYEVRGTSRKDISHLGYIDLASTAATHQQPAAAGAGAGAGAGRAGTGAGAGAGATGARGAHSLAAPFQLPTSNSQPRCGSGSGCGV